MNNKTINPEILRKKNSKKKETAEQRDARLEYERERKQQKQAKETEENHNA